MAPEQAIELTLRYEGPDVDDGSMSIQDIVPVLQGFASAYGKIANAEAPGTSHRLKITGVRPGSTKILLEVVQYLHDHAISLGGAASAVTIATGIVTTIIGVVRLKKHVQKQPFSERITQSNRIEIKNSQNVTIEMPLNVYNIFKNGDLDKDLDKMTSPLVPGRIDAAEIEVAPPNGLILRERIDVEERPYFEAGDPAVTSSSPTWLVAKLNSLTKSTNSGFMYLSDGTRVFYRFDGNDPYVLHALFGTYDGPVRVYAKANLDANLKPVSVAIYAIERAQGDLLAGLIIPSDDSDD